MLSSRPTVAVSRVQVALPNRLVFRWLLVTKLNFSKATEGDPRMGYLGKVYLLRAKPTSGYQTSLNAKTRYSNDSKEKHSITGGGWLDGTFHHYGYS